MGDTTRRRLRNFEGRTTVPMQGWCAVVIGLLFAGAGTIPLLIGVGMMAWATGPTRPPGWVIAVAGAVFNIFGLAALSSGARSLYRRRRARRAYLTGATAPWDSDHPWERGGARDDVLAACAAALRVDRLPRALPLAVPLPAPDHHRGHDVSGAGRAPPPRLRRHPALHLRGRRQGGHAGAQVREGVSSIGAVAPRCIFDVARPALSDFFHGSQCAVESFDQQLAEQISWAG